LKLKTVNKKTKKKNRGKNKIEKPQQNKIQQLEKTKRIRHLQQEKRYKNSIISQ